MDFFKNGFIRDGDVNEVERILIKYLNRKFKSVKLSGRDVDRIGGEFLSEFYFYWDSRRKAHPRLSYRSPSYEAAFNPPPWLPHGGNDLDSYVKILMSDSGVIENPRYFGSALGWIVGILKYVPITPLIYPPRTYVPIVEALAKSPDNKMFYDYIQRKLVIWDKEIRRERPDLIKEYGRQYKIMRALIA